MKSEDYPFDSLIYRLLKRAEIRRSITSRRSVQEGQPDRIAELLVEAAREIDELRTDIENARCDCGC